MIEAAFKALGDLTSPEFRSVLWKAIGLALALFVAIFAGVQALFYFLTFFQTPWLETFRCVLLFDDAGDFGVRRIVSR
jgi:CysZ protein